jgi:DNA-binding CsgD family transcriptional regulator
MAPTPTETSRGPESAPDGLIAYRLEVAGDEVVVFSFEAREGAPGSLTPAEAEIAVALVAGASNAEIARARGTSERTVANQIASIFRKLGVASRAGLLGRCRRSERLSRNGT